MNKPNIVVWFSCGAASAVALKETIERYSATHNIIAVNNYVKEEDDDNRRFLRDVSNWLNIQIEQAVNPRYPSGSCVEVWEDRQYMSGVAGAPCTLELKKHARRVWESKNEFEHMVLGFTLEEKERYWNFRDNEDSRILPVLIDAKITKKKCYEIIKQAGIELPRIYSMGYPNANCIGCVKATSPTYWNHVRTMHPDVFAARAEQSAEIGAKLVRVNGKRILLKDLPPDAKGKPLKNMDFECGIFCKK